MRYLLFTTEQCPKCPAMKEKVKELSFEGEVIDNKHKDFAILANLHAVQKAPTLIVLNEQGEETFRGEDLSEVAQFVEREKQLTELVEDYMKGNVEVEAGANGTESI